MQKVRWGMIGAGRHARLWMAPAINRATNSQLAGVWSRDPANASQLATENLAPRVHESLPALLADRDIDAVLISTPNSLHAEHAQAALAAGKHVLVEKPMATSVEAAAAMVTAAESAKRILGVGFHFRHNGIVAEARRRVIAGAIGSIAQVTAQFNLSSSAPPRLNIAHAPWKRDPEQMGFAGALMGMGVHLIDTVRFVTGQEVLAVQALSSGQTADSPLETMGQALLELSDGAQAHLLYGGRFPLSQNNLVVYGSSGRLVGEEVIDVVSKGRLTQAQPDDAHGWRGETVAPVLVDHYQAEIEAFSAAVRGGPDFAASGVDGLRVVEVTAAIIEAASSGQRIAIEQHRL